MLTTSLMTISTDKMSLTAGWASKWPIHTLAMYSLWSQESWRGRQGGEPRQGVPAVPVGCGSGTHRPPHPTSLHTTSLKSMSSHCAFSSGSRWHWWQGGDRGSGRTWWHHNGSGPPRPGFPPAQDDGRGPSPSGILAGAPWDPRQHDLTILSSRICDIMLPCLVTSLLLPSKGEGMEERKEQRSVVEAERLVGTQSPKLVWLQFETRGTLVASAPLHSQGKARGQGTRASAPRGRLGRYHHGPFPVIPAAALLCPSLLSGAAATSFYTDGETEAQRELRDPKAPNFVDGQSGFCADSAPQPG